jgi:hypothetical protein
VCVDVLYGDVLSRRRFVEETFCRGDVLYVRCPALCGITQDLHTNSIQKSPVLCSIARDHGPSLCGIAPDHDPALCRIARDQHIFVNFSTNSNQNSKIF